MHFHPDRMGQAALIRRSRIRSPKNEQPILSMSDQSLGAAGPEGASATQQKYRLEE